MATPLSSIEGKYEVLEKLSEGGMGAIYKVRHRLLDEIRVVKVMQPQHEHDEGLRARFLREARMAVKLRHANIAQMYDFAVDEGGNAFIVMEYIEGITLQQLLERLGPPPLWLAIALMRGSLAALGYLHRRGIVHRDISPDNIMATRDEDGMPAVKLIDLGIAKLVEGDLGLTASGMFLGKLRYASPEQFQPRETSPIDARSDLYSLGLVLYELLTGKHPITGSTPPALIAGHLLNPPLDFATSDPDDRVPADLREIVIRAMAKLPAERFASAGDFSRALEAVQARFKPDPSSFDRALEADGGPTQRIAVPARTSAQGKLDRHFHAVTTPAPSPTPAEPASPMSSERVAGSQHTRALLIGAEKLARLEHHEEARMQLLAVLQLEPDHLRARELLAEVEAALEGGKTMSRGHTAAVAVAVETIRAHLDRGELREALDRLRDAEAAFGQGASELGPLRSRLADLDDAEILFAKARELIARSDTLLAEGSAEEALAAVREAVDLDPRVSGGPETLARAKAAVSELERRRTEARRDEQCGIAVAEIQALTAACELDRAARQLVKAERQFGDDPRLAVARGLLEEAQAAAVRARVAELRDDARTALARGRHQVAIAKLQQALGLAPADPTLEAALGAAQAAQEEAEQARAAEEARSEAAAAVLRLAEVGTFDAAERALAELVATWGEGGPVESLRAAIAQARGKAVQTRVVRLLGEAREAGEALRFDAAIESLEAALELTPGDLLITELLAETKAGKRRHIEERKRARAVAAAVARIEGAVSIAGLDGALSRLAEAEAELGAAQELSELRARLEDRLRRKLEAEIAELLEGARALIDAEAFEDALDLIERARRLDPSHAESAWMMAAAEEGAHRQAEKRRRENKVAQAIASVEGCLERGNLDEALRELTLAERVYGGEESVVALRSRVERLRRAARRGAVDRQIANARQLAASGKLEQAIAELRQAAAVEPEEGSIKAALEEILRQQAEASVAALLDRGDFKGAERALTVAERFFGRIGALPELRRLLREGRDEAE
ncbi:MAG: protein kinase [Acidobacteriota bacterium]